MRRRDAARRLARLASSNAPSFVDFTSNKLPLSFPSSTVGYHVSKTLSPNANGSVSNTNFLTVITFM